MQYEVHESKVVFGAVSAFSTKTLIRLRRRMRNSARKRDVVDVHRFDCTGECGMAATLDDGQAGRSILRTFAGG